MNMRKSIDFLMISKVRIKSLKYFFFNPDMPIHLRGAVRKFKEEINAVRRELNRLEEIKLLLTEKRGNRKYYSVNKEHPYYDVLLAMMHKTFGLGGDLLKSVKKLGEVKYILLTSSYTQGVTLEPHDVDLVVVGDVDIDLLGEIVGLAEKKVGKELNYTVLSESDFDLRKKRRDAFVSQLIFGDNVLVYGNKSQFVS
ncbi:hypothetical protein GF389_06040 [Candidatus Dojkabacteria bacterium]|nr:hypothetical protein [Candidatus Dojkabacteria bacterium]